MKPKIKINMSKLSVGGMEKALVNLINISKLAENYDVTLLLVYNDEKNYLNELPKNITLDFVVKGKWNFFGKMKAIIGLSYRYLKSCFSKNSYEASICYSHHHGILAKITRKESSNSICFIHTDLIHSRTENELNILKKKMAFEKFSKIICVSHCAKGSFTKIYPNYQGKVYIANNYIDDNSIVNSSKETITDVHKEELITFLNVARHDDSHKKISRIIKASKRLKEQNKKFRVLLIGDGIDHHLYEQMIQDGQLSDCVFLLGKKINPFPYYKIADAFILSSQYEGYGIVLDEARVLNIPIISTDIADAKQILEDGYGILCTNDEEGIYQGMKQFLEKGYIIKERFDVSLFNSNSNEVIYQAIER